MAMDMEACLRLIASRQDKELVVTSAGNSSELWWEITGDTERVFYLEASMSLSTMFAAGLAMSYRDARVWAFVGDGAFVMNTGMLFTERVLALPNMVSIIVANRRYGATSATALPDGDNIDFAGLAKTAGIPNVHSFDTLKALENGFDAAFRAPVQSYVVLEVDVPSGRHHSPPFDGPELKYRFGRALERQFDRKVLP